MTNPVIHALVLIAAIIIPGGLLVYFGWRMRDKCKNAIAAKRKAQRDVDPIEEIRDAFFHVYPKESLRGKSKRERLAAARRRKRFNPKNSPR